jgi:hypothetical protein
MIYLYIISPSYIVRINELTLVLEIIGQCDAKHIMTLPINQKTSVPKASTYIITTDVNLDNEYCLYSKYRGSSDIYRLLNPENVEMHKRYIKIRR